MMITGKSDMTSTGNCFNRGNTVKMALLQFEKTHQPYSGSTAPYTAGNGFIMCITPLGILS